MAHPVKIALFAIPIFLVVPPMWSAARDTLLLVQAGSDNHQEARAILVADIDRASSRQFEARSIAAQPVPAVSEIPVNMPRSPEPNLAEALPTCSGDVPFGVRVSRGAAVDDARYRSLSERLSSVQLIMMNACVQASPFAARCVDDFWKERGKVTAAELTEKLVASGAVRGNGGRVCWIPAASRNDAARFATVPMRSADE